MHMLVSFELQKEMAVDLVTLESQMKPSEACLAEYGGTEKPTLGVLFSINSSALRLILLNVWGKIIHHPRA